MCCHRAQEQRNTLSLLRHIAAEDMTAAAVSVRDDTDLVRQPLPVQKEQVQ